MNVEPVNSSNLLAQAAVVPQPLLPADTAAERNYVYFELDNAATLAASVGLGVHVDFSA